METLLWPPPQETAGFAAFAQRLRHNFIRTIADQQVRVLACHPSQPVSLVNLDRVDGRRRSLLRPSPHHDHHQMRSSGDLGVPSHSSKKHNQRRLEIIHGCRRRSGGVILASSYVTPRQMCCTPTVKNLFQIFNGLKMPPMEYNKSSVMNQPTVSNLFHLLQSPSF